MQKVLSVRIEEDDLAFIKKESKEENLDKAKILREIVKKGRLQIAIEQYKSGKISLGKASEKSGLTISEIIDKLAELGIKNPMTKEQYFQGLKNLEKIW